MKKVLLTSLTFLALGMANAQLTNLGFETWTSTDPDAWTTTNAAASGSVAQETAVPGTGVISARINVSPCPLCPLAGLPNPLPGFVIQRWASNVKPAMVTFKWRGSVASGDTALIGSFLTLTGDPIADAIIQLPGGTSQATWLTANIPYTYYSGLDPDTLSIGAVADQYLLLSYGGTSSASTSIYVDDFSISGGTVGYDMLETDNSLIMAYPNPATTFVNLNLLGTDASKIDVMDINGKLVYTESNILSKHMLNVEGFENGSYIIRFTNDKSEYVGTAKFNVVK